MNEFEKKKMVRNKNEANVNHDQFIKQIIAHWQKGQKIFAFLYWI